MTEIRRKPYRVDSTPDRSAPVHMNTGRSQADGSSATRAVVSFAERIATANRDSGVGSGKASSHRQRRAVSGTAFTLVEVLVAMAVLGIMAAAVLGGLSWCLTSVRLARENLRATQIIVEKMEVIRLLTWDQINDPNLIPTTFTAPYYSATGASNDTGGLTYYGSVSVLPPVSWQLSGAVYTNDLRVVAVRVYWTNQGLPHQRQLNSYVSRYGIQNYAIN